MWDEFEARTADRRADGLELGEDRPLDGQILRGRLDHQPRVGEQAIVGAVADGRQDSGRGGRTEGAGVAALGHLPFDLLLAPQQRLGGNVHQQHPDPVGVEGLGKVEGDIRADLAGSDDADLPANGAFQTDSHGALLGQALTRERVTVAVSGGGSLSCARGPWGWPKRARSGSII